MNDSITNATKHFVPAPRPYNGRYTTTAVFTGVWLTDDEAVEWIINENGEAIGYTITKKKDGMGF